MQKEPFYSRMKRCAIEREVEDIYNEGISFYFPGSDMGHPFGCDGFLDTKTKEGKTLKLVIEYKMDEELSNRVARARVLAQVVCYLKKFEQDGMVLPNVCMVGDVNECFVMHTNPLLGYLDGDYDWSVAPSSAGAKLPTLVAGIADNEEVNPFVFSIGEGFDFGMVAQKISDLANDIVRFVHVTEHNCAAIFEYFKTKVLKDRKATAHEMATAFIGVISDRENYYRHPTKKNALVIPSKTIQIDGAAYDAFFKHFDRKYSPQETMNFTAIADRLIEDESRRRRGDFFTPTPFVDYAHKMISEWLGDNWKDEYVVWDNCCGTKNLTRDYRFGELYCSTLEQSELDVSERYNREATSFQFDFLNDDIGKIPGGLYKALQENRKILFFMNPPYATACTGAAADGTSRPNIAKNTETAKRMRDNGYGSVSEALHAQFLYRILEIKKEFGLTNCKMAVFCKPVFLTGPKYKKFRGWFNEKWNYNDGILFRASQFDDCSDKWGISFNLWDGTGTVPSENEMYIVDGNIHDGNFVHKLVDFDENRELVVIGLKNLYNADSVMSMSEWVREPIKEMKSIDRPNLSSACVIKDSNGTRGMSFDEAFGYYLNNPNNVSGNAQKVALFTSPASMGNGCGVGAQNFRRCIAAFAARKSIPGNWMNDKDEYMRPFYDDPYYDGRFGDGPESFYKDALIYSLFHSSSQQSSLRSVRYHGKTWDIVNEFFWVPRSKMMELADKWGNQQLYIDANSSSDRFMAKECEKCATAEGPAGEIYALSNQLVEDSFRFRPLYDDEHPEMQINNWDCGYYQMKGMWKQYCPDGFEKLRELYKKLELRIRERVYEFGMLRK